MTTKADAVLRVRHAGPLVTVQDGGRPGLLRFGVPASGPMDGFAHAAANTVLGRPPLATAVEVSLGGLAVECVEGALSVSVCGGSFAVDHDGEVCAPWVVRTLRAGEVLRVRAGRWGSWCYLGLAGELDAARWLGSTSTHVRAGVGGAVVQAGDVLVVRDAHADEAREGDVEAPSPPLAPSLGAALAAELRVVLGPQLDCFEPGATEALLGAPYVLTAAYDRMGVRLDGPHLALGDALAIPSTPIVRGSLQVAGDGVPTLLFAEHQTTGGYPKIATVVSADAEAACQLRSGDAVRFVAIDAAEAVQVARLRAVERATQIAALADRPGLRTRRLITTNLIGGVFHPDGDTAADPNPMEPNR